MSNGDRFLTLDEFDEAFRSRYTGFAPVPPVPAQEHVQGLYYQQPQQQMPQQRYQPPQPEPYQTPEYQSYQAYPSELPPFEDPFLTAAQSPAPQQQWPPMAGGYQAAPEPEEVLPPPQKDNQRLTKQLVMIGITVVVAILVAAAVLVPKLAFGYEILSMNTTEMAPKIPLGSLVIIKKVDYKELKKKNVIAYEFEKGKPVIRRITRLHPETRSFSVKGDAAATSVTVSNDRLRGVVRRTVKYLGYPLYLLRSTPAKIAAVVVAVLLWAAIFLLISGYGKPKVPENGPENETEMPQPAEQPMPQQMPPQNPYYST